MLRLIEEQWPDFNPVARMIEQAEKTRLEMIEREEACAKAAKGEDHEGDPVPVTAAERAILSQMYERPARYLVPQLRATEISAAPDGGSFTVTINRPDAKS